MLQPLDSPVYPWNVYSIYPSVTLSAPLERCSKVAPIRLATGYPTLAICACFAAAYATTMLMPALDEAVYPYNLEMIYPLVKADDVKLPVSEAMTIRLKPVYPHFDLCR